MTRRMHGAALLLGLALVLQPMELLAGMEIARGGGGRGASRGGSGARTGFSSFSGGSTRSNLRLDSRPAERSGRVDTRQGNRTDRTDLRQSNRSNWAVNRPWRYGWYGGTTWNSWGWWPGRAAAWGIGSLASFAVINSLVENAVSNETTVIVVPNSSYSLDYGSVQVSGDLITFQAHDGSSSFTFRADCRAGTLNGYQPQNASEAQLLNAACQVAFGQ